MIICENNDMQNTVLCPNCKKEVVWSQESPFRPFCSERCRLIDLGAWADGSYSIPSPETPEQDSDEPAAKSEDTEDPDATS